MSNNLQKRISREKGQIIDVFALYTVGQRMSELLRGAGLTQNQTAIMARYYFDGQSQPEIAAELGVKRSTVANTIRAAQARLQKHGLPKAKRVQSDRRPRLILMDPADMNDLGPDDLAPTDT